MSPLVATSAVAATTAAWTILLISAALVPLGTDAFTDFSTMDVSAVTSSSGAGSALTDASTMLLISEAESCPPVALVTAASISAALTPGTADAATAASTILLISAGDAVLGADAATDLATSAAIAAVSITGAGAAAGAAGSSAPPHARTPIMAIAATIPTNHLVFVMPIRILYSSSCVISFTTRRNLTSSTAVSGSFLRTRRIVLPSDPFVKTSAAEVVRPLQDCHPSLNPHFPDQPRGSVVIR